MCNFFCDRLKMERALWRTPPPRLTPKNRRQKALLMTKNLHHSSLLSSAALFINVLSSLFCSLSSVISLHASLARVCVAVSEHVAVQSITRVAGQVPRKMGWVRAPAPLVTCLHVCVSITQLWSSKLCDVEIINFVTTTDTVKTRNCIISRSWHWNFQHFQSKERLATGAECFKKNALIDGAAGNFFFRRTWQHRQKTPNT